MTDLEAQIQSELQRIVEVVTEMTGLASRWSGRVELVPNADFKGKKRFTCDIHIDAGLASTQERWSTLIHEALHTVSTGYIGSDYRKYPGWEEGIIEKLQRLLRAVILDRLDITLPPSTLIAIEAEHRYNPYIEALETLRSALKMDEMRFYLHLLGTPIKDRPGYIFGVGNQMMGVDRTNFIRAYSVASSVLRGLPPYIL